MEASWSGTAKLTNKMAWPRFAVDIHGTHV